MGVLARWLRRLAMWLDPPVRTPLDLRAAVLVTEQQTHWPDRSGEAKRHQVYAQLLKEFPGATGRACAAAIEAAVQRL